MSPSGGVRYRLIDTISEATQGLVNNRLVSSGDNAATQSLRVTGSRITTRTACNIRPGVFRRATSPLSPRHIRTFCLDNYSQDAVIAATCQQSDSCSPAIEAPCYRRPSMSRCSRLRAVSTPSQRLGRLRHRLCRIRPALGRLAIFQPDAKYGARLRQTGLRQQARLLQENPPPARSRQSHDESFPFAVFPLIQIAVFMHLVGVKGRNSDPDLLSGSDASKLPPNRAVRWVSGLNLRKINLGPPITGNCVID